MTYLITSGIMQLASDVIGRKDLHVLFPVGYTEHALYRITASAHHF